MKDTERTSFLNFEIKIDKSMYIKVLYFVLSFHLHKHSIAQEMKRQNKERERKKNTAPTPELSKR